MARLTSDAFLPSGAIESIHASVFGNQPVATPLGKMAQMIPECNPSTFQMGDHASSHRPSTSQPTFSARSGDASTISPRSLVPTKDNNGSIPSPVGRNTSIKESKALIIEDWRSYTNHLREQARGEWVHFVADRNRMDEIMAEERILWDKEREDLNDTIRSLRRKVEKLEENLGRCGSQHRLVDSVVPPGDQNAQSGVQHLHQPTPTSLSQPDRSNTTSNLVLQESGRNPDGSRFYAPAPRNPTRSFGEPQNNELRVDSMLVPRETPLRVTSKELTQSDFETQSPTSKTGQEGSVVSEVIDISYIRPDLEGVLIKATAVSPTFAASVLSPPLKGALSLTSSPPKSDGINNTMLLRTVSQDKNSILEVKAESTPPKNYLTTAFDLEYSQNATPTQHQRRTHYTSMAPEEIRQFDGNIDADPELQEPLGLRNDPPTDALFLAALTNKLNEVQESGLLPSSKVSMDSEKQKPSASNLSMAKQGVVAIGGNDNNPENSDDEPQLRMKPSFNFGRPFGTL
jgi:hypothetical protein